jgi:hypothetical protein
MYVELQVSSYEQFFNFFWYLNGFQMSNPQPDADGYYDAAFVEYNRKNGGVTYPGCSIKELPGWLVGLDISTDWVDFEKNYAVVTFSTNFGSNEYVKDPMHFNIGHTTKPANFEINPNAYYELYINAYQPKVDMNVDGNVNYAYGMTDSNFVKPRIYSGGGYLYISMTKNHFLIASSDVNRCSWTPGIGIVKYKPEILDYYGVQFGSYNKNITYSNWLYFSMNGTTNISGIHTFNIKSNKDEKSAEETWAAPRPTYPETATYHPYPSNAPKLLYQLKSQYLNSVTNPTGMNIPKRTMNYNFKPSVVCARVCVCNKLISPNDNPNNYNPDHYDNGGDVSALTPIYMINSGPTLGFIDVVLPHQDKVDMTNPDDKKQYDEKRWGKYIIWDSMVSSNKTLETKSTFKYIVWYG